MQKHAYLIIAHNEFEILELLISALDDVRNDIYVHFDAKVERLPSLKSDKSTLVILENRKRVYWGDYSQIETEMELFESAFNNQKQLGVEYLYYHLISGVDIPLKNQDYIHRFFNANQGKEFIGFFQGDLSVELRKKAQIFHLFPQKFTKQRIYTFSSIVRALFAKLQLVVGVIRNGDIDLTRGTNWSSVTNDFVAFLLSQRQQIYKRFHHTFCADEIYKHTLCWNSDFRDKVYDLKTESLGCMREINWVITETDSFLPSFTMNDYRRLKESKCLFARKFDGKNINIAERIIKELK
ncbi:MAG: glycosyl transferase [Alistipes sp.]|nr:glycosyl transferase [Alistipes sp.]